MLLFFRTIYGQFTIIAAAIATIWGFCKAIGALKKWIDNKIKLSVLRKQNNAKMVSVMSLISLQIKGIKNDIKNMNKDISLLKQETKTLGTDINTAREEISQLNILMKDNNECTSTVMLLKMMWAYHNYVLAKNKIPLDVKTALCAMYDQYKKDDCRNHVPEDFKLRICLCEVIG